MSNIHLSNLHEFSLQQIFNKVATHLLTQNEKAQIINVNGFPACQYHAPDGKMCAVGCLISEDEYDMSMEGDGAENIVMKVNDEFANSTLPYDHRLQILGDLQAVHDDSSVDMWRNDLAEVAERFDLDDSVLRA